jgi:hypothetical protein
LRDHNKNIGAIIWWLWADWVDGKLSSMFFGVHYQCRSRTFLGGSKWRACCHVLPL